MKSKYVSLLLLAASMALAGCNKTEPSPEPGPEPEPGGGGEGGGGEGGGGEGGGGEGGETEDALSDAILEFLKSRGVTGVTLPNKAAFDALTETDILEEVVIPEETEDYYPCYYLALSGDKLEDFIVPLELAGWNVPEEPGEYGYECVDPNEKIEMDIAYYEAEGDYPEETDVTIYAYDDIAGGEEQYTLAELVQLFLTAKEIEIEVPFVLDVAADDVLSYGADEDPDCVYAIVDGMHEEAIAQLLTTANYTINEPTQENPFFVAADPEQKIVIEYAEYEYSDGEEGGYTYFYLYSYKEYTDEGGGDEPPVENEMVFDFSTRTEKQEGNTYAPYIDAAASDTFPNMYGSTLLFMQACVSTGTASELTEATSRTVASGNGSGGAFENQAGFLKFGSSKNQGTLTLTFATAVESVTVAMRGWNQAGKDFLSVNNEIKEAPCEGTEFTQVTYTFAQPTTTVAFISCNQAGSGAGRLFIQSIAVTFSDLA